MKFFILLQLLIINTGAAIAQENYYVTVIKGTVLKTDGSKIIVGTKLSLMDKVILSSKESLLILLHPAKGRFIVSPKAASFSKDNKFTLLVKDYLELHVQNVRHSSRAFDDAPISLADYFKTNTEVNNKILVIDTLKVKIHRMEFANVDNTENFFFLRLAMVKLINHKLQAVNNTLLISRSDIVFNDNLYSKEAGQLKLGYIENYSKDKKVKLITTVELVFIPKEECRNIIKSIKAS